MARRLLRALVLVACLVATIAPCRPVWATGVAIRDLTLETRERPVSARLFQPPGKSSHPAVVILHGRQGIDPYRPFYESFAEAMASAGFDAYLVDYYSAQDAAQMQAVDPQVRRSLFSRRLDGWSAQISDIVTDLARHGRRRIGLIGFSQGGFVAAAAAASDPRIAAMTVFYGGIPDSLKGRTVHLPPLLELHGDADRVVPLEQGRALADLARTTGRHGEIVVYKGAGHGFEGQDEADAEARTVAFLRTWLGR